MRWDAMPASTYVTGLGQGRAAVSASISAALGGGGGGGGGGVGGWSSVLSISGWGAEGSRSGGGEAARVAGLDGPGVGVVSSLMVREEVSGLMESSEYSRAK